MTYRTTKRLFDLICSGIGLILLSPLLLLIAYRIKKEDGGPVFYRGERVGLHGKTFRIFKFRSMIVNAEKLGASSTTDEDPRITEVGKLLRKHKIDESPQLINVLTGQMSLVGSRPEVSKFTDIYTDAEKALLTVKPGITDWESIWNSDEGAILAGAEDADRAYLELIRPEKIRLQLKYVKERSFVTDIKILFQTVAKLFEQSRSAAKVSHDGVEKTSE